MMKKNVYRTVTCGILAGIIFFLTLALFCLPKQNFSENENRYLADWPSLSWKKIEDGTYMEQVSTWLADHFPQRNFFMGLKAKVEIALGKKEINGVYIGDNDYLIEVYEKPVHTERIASTLNRFYEKLDTKTLDIHLMLVPTAQYILGDQLPPNTPSGNQMETAHEIYEKSKIPGIDCSSKLKEAKNQGQVYYYTDHHWTTYGAYQGYLAFCQAKGIIPIPLSQLETEQITESFYGTIYSKVNNYHHQADTIVLYTNPLDQLTVYYPDTDKRSSSLYNLDYVEEKDKYSLFLDNLHPLVEITNETAETDRELVLIKDSYANCMVPFLVRHYQKIYVLDTRSYKQGPSAFIQEHPTVTDVLLLYNLNTLDTDSGIRGIY